jgi:hypothetical protein
MLIELDIFSGRPNPRWQLDERIARQLAALHRKLPAIGEPRPEPSGLGYRGFIYSLDGGPWRASRGVVFGSDQMLADPARAIERLLLDHLPAEYGDLRPLIAAELEPST